MDRGWSDVPLLRVFYMAGLCSYNVLLEGEQGIFYGCRYRTRWCKANSGSSTGLDLHVVVFQRMLKFWRKKEKSFLNVDQQAHDSVSLLTALQQWKWLCYLHLLSSLSEILEKKKKSCLLCLKVTTIKRNYSLHYNFSVDQFFTIVCKILRSWLSLPPRHPPHVLFSFQTLRLLVTVNLNYLWVDEFYFSLIWPLWLGWLAMICGASVPGIWRSRLYVLLSTRQWNLGHTEQGTGNFEVPYTSFALITCIYK